MTNRINCYESSARELFDSLGTAEDLDAGEVGAACMALCEMVRTLELKIAKLEKAQAGNQRTADLASMLANGIKPD